MIVIEVKKASFTYEEGTKALDGVDFHARRGEFIGLLGSNGGGKTTFLKVLVGLLRPQQGEVLIDGEPIGAAKPRELYQKIGLVLQNPNDQLFAPTLIEDVSFGPANLGLSKQEVKNRVTEALMMVDLEDCASKPIHHLSFGQQKRACIAGVLAMRPKILILDEATSGLDHRGEQKIMHLLGRLNKESGMTIIMATHLVDMLPLFIDRLYVLTNGKVTKEGSPLEVFSDSEMMQRANLRLPYIAHLIEELKSKDKVQIDGLPLTVGEARRKLLELINNGAG